MDFIDNLYTEMIGRLRASHESKQLNKTNIEESFREPIKLVELTRDVFLLLIICYIISIFVFISELFKKFNVKVTKPSIIRIENKTTIFLEENIIQL